MFLGTFKKIRQLFNLFVIAVLAAAFSVSAYGKTSDYIRLQNAGIIHIGVTTNIHGFSVQDPVTGEFTGFEIDLANLIASDLGFQANFIPVNYDERFEKLDTGDVDILIASVTINEQRKRLYDFSIPYHAEYTSVLALRSSKINNISGLLGKKVGSLEGSYSALILVKEMINRKLIEYENFSDNDFDVESWDTGVEFVLFDNFNDSVKKLDNGEIAGIVFDRTALNNYKSNTRVVIKDKISPEPFGICCRKGSDLIPKLNYIIKHYLMDVTIDRLEEKYGID